MTDLILRSLKVFAKRHISSGPVLQDQSERKPLLPVLTYCSNARKIWSILMIQDGYQGKAQKSQQAAGGADVGPHHVGVDPPPDDGVISCIGVVDDRTYETPGRRAPC